MKIRNNTRIGQHGERQRANMLAARTPGIAFLIVNFIAVILYQFFFEGWSVILLFVFALQMTVLAIQQWFAYKLVQFSTWIYFILQGMFTFGITFIVENTNDSYNVIVFTLYAYFIGQAIGLVSRRRVYTICFLTLLLVLNVFLLIPKGELKHFLIIVPIMLLIIAYAVMFFSQVNERINAQVTLERLEFAHEQVEQLILQNERQRMARDLHDTLAQGLVGFSMQLDAANSHLSLSNTTKASEIISNARSNAKQLLAEARLAIDNLRESEKEKIDFKKKIEASLDYFSSTTNIDFDLEYHLDSDLDGFTQENCYYIIRESVMNTVKHSNAKNVKVQMLMGDKFYHFSIIDDGKGFNTSSALRKKGSYGLLGIKERVTQLYGNVSFHSEIGKGTEIVIDIPRSRSEENV